MNINVSSIDADNDNEALKLNKMLEMKRNTAL